MKAQSDNRPKSIQDIGRGYYYVNMDIHEVTIDDRTSYEYDCVKILGYPTYGATVDALIREKYSESEELAIQRQRDSKPATFAEYNEFCESCKDKARPVFFPEA